MFPRVFHYVGSLIHVVSISRVPLLTCFGVFWMGLFYCHHRVDMELCSVWNNSLLDKARHAWYTGLRGMLTRLRIVNYPSLVASEAGKLPRALFNLRSS